MPGSSLQGCWRGRPNRRGWRVRKSVKSLFFRYIEEKLGVAPGPPVRKLLSAHAVSGTLDAGQFRRARFLLTAGGRRSSDDTFEHEAL